MNGASAEYGTICVGIPAPATVGAAVSEKMEPAAFPADDADEAAVVDAEVADDEEALVIDVEDCCVDEVLDVCVAVLKLGKSVS